MLFPGPNGHDLGLIVDGDAQVDEDRISATPAWAVLHRPALEEVRRLAPFGPV
jgi:hypothetical protein